MAEQYGSGMYKGMPIAVRVQPGEPVPEGYVSIPEVRFKSAPNAADGMPMTPHAYRGLLPEMKAKRLSHMGEGKFGAQAHIEFSDGRVRPVPILDEHDARDPLFENLTKVERKTILDYLTSR